jgi:hypothetical protein
MMELMLILVWFGLALVVGVAAERRMGRNGAGWFFLSLLITPLLGGFYLLWAGPKRGEFPARGTGAQALIAMLSVAVVIGGINWAGSRLQDTYRNGPYGGCPIGGDCSGQHRY